MAERGFGDPLCHDLAAVSEIEIELVKTKKLDIPDVLPHSVVGCMGSRPVLKKMTQI